MRYLLWIAALLSSLAAAQPGNFPALVGARGTTLPTNCAVGQLFFKTDATAGQNIYECASANTWTQQLNNGADAGLTAGYLVSTGTSGVLQSTTTGSSGYISPSLLINSASAPTVVSASLALYATSTGGGVFQGSGSTADFTFLNQAGSSFLTLGNNPAMSVYPIALSGTTQGAASISPRVSSSGTLTGYGIAAGVETAASSFTLTNARPVWITNLVKGSTSAVTNNYGLYIDALSGGASLNRAISTNGGDHAFGGNVNITGALQNSTTVTMTGLTAASGTPNSICQNSATKEITVNAALTCTVSSARFKTHIAPFQRSATSMIAAIQPDVFTYKDRPDRPRLGLIAENLALVDRRLSEWDAEGRPNSIDFSAMIALLVKANQEQQAQIRRLESQLKQLLK